MRGADLRQDMHGTIMMEQQLCSKSLGQAETEHAEAVNIDSINKYLLLASLLIDE